MATYGDYAIHVEVTGAALGDGTTAGFCIAQADYGMTCSIGMNTNSTEAGERFASLWYAKADYAAKVTEFKAATAAEPMDLTSETDNIIDATSYLFGLDQYS